MQVLFRAKEKNSNNYVIGYEYYNHVEDEYYITHYVSGSNYKVDRTTRSINIEDMLDSQENKIFASLSATGKGGDIVEDCLINFDYDEYIIKGYLFFDNPSKAILVHNFFERTKRKNEQFASEHRPKVKYSSYQSLLRAKVIGMQK